MKNRILALLLLIWIFWGAYYFYDYYFIKNKWNLTITTNYWDYRVEMYAKQLKTTFETTCSDLTCKLLDLAPFEYTLKINKPWFKAISQDIKINSNKTWELKINFEKEITLTKIDKKEQKTETPDLKKEVIIIKAKKLQEIKNKYKFIEIPDFWMFYFDLVWNNLVLNQYNTNTDKSTPLYTFEKIDANNLDIKQIYNDINSIFIKYWEKKYIYNINSWTIKEISFPGDITYIKKYLSTYNIITKNWTFIYDVLTGKAEFFYPFKDFVYFKNDFYIWIINKDETEKIANYNLWTLNSNVIIKYNFKTKESNILKEINENISKIYFDDEKLYFDDENWNKYMLENI